MKTIIKIKTWGCICGYHQDFELTDELMIKHFNCASALCPSCKKANLIKETNPDKKVVLTIIGEEDIETEIERENEERTKGNKAKRTEAEKTAYRNKRKKDIQQAIIEAKKLED